MVINLLSPFYIKLWFFKTKSPLATQDTLDRSKGLSRKSSLGFKVEDGWVLELQHSVHHYQTFLYVVDSLKLYKQINQLIL